ncbi:MAG: hypothetical protein V4515_00935 [Chloroflexota bacterium]
MADRPHAVSHASHDLELVAAVVAGDAVGTEAERGAALIRSCAECEAIATDLRALRVATRGLGSAFDGSHGPAPRDFRLAPADAERIGRRRGIGFMNPGRARSWASRLGTGLVAVGLAALVLSAAPLNLLGGAGGAAFGTKVEQQDATTAPLGPGQAGAPSSNLSVLATGTPERAVDSNAPAGERDGAGSPTLVTIGGAGLVLGIALLLASRSGRRAGP